MSSGQRLGPELNKRAMATSLCWEHRLVLTDAMHAVVGKFKTVPSSEPTKFRHGAIYSFVGCWVDYESQGEASIFGGVRGC
jgi:hypothetical protein